MTHNDHVGLHEIAVEISEECPFSSLGFGAWTDAEQRAGASADQIDLLCDPVGEASACLFGASDGKLKLPSEEAGLAQLAL
jgi:hypothetical protein